MVFLQRRPSVLICLALAAAVATVYWPVCYFGFVNYDDDVYITQNTHLQAGLSFQGLVWAFTTRLDHWMPVTWLARLILYELFGLDAGSFHLVNALFHIANVVLLFCLLNRMTGALWQSVFVASLFGLHPLQVESVAWVTEFKNVFSTCFWMMTIWAYVRYAERPNAPQYWLTLGLYGLGLMTKPMLVTLPFTLLLLDFWPLGRTRWARAAVGVRETIDFKRLIGEKLPFMMLSVAVSTITYVVRTKGAYASDLKSIPLFLRISHAVVSYVKYVVKMVWPVNLAVFYPHPFFPRPEVLRLPEAVLAALAVVCLTVFLCRTARHNPPLAVGWLWYLGTLVPVIGFVQDGGQSIADRFTYVPSIGLFIMAAWGLSKLVSGRVRAEMVAKGLTAGVIIALLLTTRHQLQFWANSVSLFQHAIAVTQGNYIAENNLGVALRERGQMEQAATHFQRAIDIWPGYNEAYKNLADILLQMDRFNEAIPYYRRLLERKPGWSEAHNSLGVALMLQGELEKAVEHFARAAELDPRDPLSQRNLAVALSRLGRSEAALEHAIRAVQLNPQDAQAQYVMKLLLKKSEPKTQGVVPAAGALTPSPTPGPR
jgi:tetratricopeptide (TPR) repeat protein